MFCRSMICFSRSTYTKTKEIDNFHPSVDFCFFSSFRIAICARLVRDTRWTIGSRQSEGFFSGIPPLLGLVALALRLGLNFISTLLQRFKTVKEPRLRRWLATGRLPARSSQGFHLDISQLPWVFLRPCMSSPYITRSYY